MSQRISKRKKALFSYTCYPLGIGEKVTRKDLKSVVLLGVRVRVPPSAPLYLNDILAFYAARVSA